MSSETAPCPAVAGSATRLAPTAGVRQLRVPRGRAARRVRSCAPLLLFQSDAGHHLVGDPPNSELPTAKSRFRPCLNKKAAKKKNSQAPRGGTWELVAGNPTCVVSWTCRRTGPTNRASAPACAHAAQPSLAPLRNPCNG